MESALARDSACPSAVTVIVVSEAVLARRAILGRSTVVLLADSALVLVGKNYEAYVAFLLGTLRTECLNVSLCYRKHLGALLTLNHGFIVNWFLIEFYVLPIHGVCTSRTQASIRPS